MENDEKFLLDVVKGICEFPDEVVVSRKVDEMGVLLTLKVDQNDMGRIIGKEGNTAKALRTLVRIVGMKDKNRVNLKIVDPRSAQVDSAYQEAKRFEY